MGRKGGAYGCLVLALPISRHAPLCSGGGCVGTEYCKRLSPRSTSFFAARPKGGGFPVYREISFDSNLLYTFQICVPFSPTYVTGNFTWLTLTLPVSSKEVRWCGPFLLIWAEGYSLSDHRRPRVLLSHGYAMVGLILSNSVSRGDCDG